MPGSILVPPCVVEEFFRISELANRVRKWWKKGGAGGGILTRVGAANEVLVLG